MAKLTWKPHQTTYIAEVEEEDDGEEAIAVDIECIHRLNLLPLRQLILPVLQVLVGDEACEARHAHATTDEVKHHEAHTCHYPLEDE